MQRSALAATIDHTLLRPETTALQVTALCAEATVHGFATVCVSSVFAGVMVPALAASAVRPGSVVGFPTGAHPATLKAAEASQLADAGVREVDMVLHVGGILERGAASVEREVSAVRTALPSDVTLKVILETAVLSDELIVTACLASAAAGADFVKTSTGLHPAGGATPRVVALMRAAVGEDVGVKASGGIRTLSQALAMLDAGADRLGTSAGVAILSELEGNVHVPFT